MTAFEERPHSPYYGCADATPLFVVLLDEYERWTGDRKLVRELEHEARAALNWIDEYADLMGNGYVSYQRRNEETGLENQCWKDSWDSISYRDGRLPGFPRATCELQGYAYDAKVRGARLARLVWKDPELADRLEKEAADLKRRFNRDFWVNDGEYFALALDTEGNQVDALTSNNGHLLWSGIVDKSKAKAVAAHLLGPRLFSGWGVRTLAEGEGRYNPIGYHVGTVWPFDNSFIAWGLRRYGFKEEAAQIAAGILDAAEFFDGRLPEAFGGYERTVTKYPVQYPTACSPQAWSTGTPLLLLRTMLGLEPLGDHLVVDPALPRGIGHLELLDIPGRWGRIDAFGRGRVDVDGPSQPQSSRCDASSDVETGGAAMSTTEAPEDDESSAGRGTAPADVLVVFGITGDLAKVMTFRSLYRLEQRGLLDCPIVGVAVDDWTVDQLTSARASRSWAPARRSTRRCSTASRPGSPTCPGDFADAATYERVGEAIERRADARLLPRDPAVPLRHGRQGPGRGRSDEDRRASSSRSRSATTRPRPASSPTSCTSTSTSRSSSGSTTSSGRWASRRSSTSGSRTRCSSRSGTGTTSSPSRSRWPRTSASRIAATSTTRSARCATSSSTTSCRSSAATAMEPPAGGDPKTIKDAQVVALPRGQRRPTRPTTSAASTTATSTSTASPRTRPPRPTPRSGWTSTTGAGRAFRSSSAPGKRLPVTQTEVRLVFKHPPRLGFAAFDSSRSRTSS